VSSLSCLTEQQCQYTNNPDVVWLRTRTQCWPDTGNALSAEAGCLPGVSKEAKNGAANQPETPLNCPTEKLWLRAARESEIQDPTVTTPSQQLPTMPRSDEAQAFFHAVYSAVQEIPPGKVTSYGHIAKLVGTRRLTPPFLYLSLPSKSRPCLVMP
jgi:hypothetical protein